ncbi:MAG TPA: hypothetical protein VFL29_10065 [Candidatus Dormibacteraeota bacterium]|nr:hypothetical protein [Candidatus Dormibacteraeota bacterium]
MVVDVMHLAVVIAGLVIGAASLIAFRTRLPRGRFVIFSAASVGALFGCAAVGGELGLLSQSQWFVVVIGFLAVIGTGGYVVGRYSPLWR